MNGQRIGYVRVSSLDQNPDRQLEQTAVDRTFTDKASGKDVARPQLDALLRFAREGDTVVVHSMDRLARNLDDLRRLVQQLTGRGIRVEFVAASPTATSAPLATSTPGAAPGTKSAPTGGTGAPVVIRHPSSSNGAAPQTQIGDCIGTTSAYNTGDMRVAAFGHMTCSGAVASQSMSLTLYKCGQTFFGGCQFQSTIQTLDTCQQFGPADWSCPNEGLAYSQYLDHGTYRVTTRHSVSFSDGTLATGFSDSENVTL